MSAIELLAYQKAVLKDQGRFIDLFWARGVRKTFTATLKIVDSVFAAEAQGRREPWNIVSRGERQALEAMQEAKKHFRAYQMVAEDIQGHDLWSDEKGRYFKVYEIQTPGKSRILSLPANPDTVRGYTANMLLDEFGIQAGEKSEALWRAAYPCLRGHLKMIVASTPQGKSGRYYRIATDDSGVWSHHRVDIYEAVAQGLPFDVDLERAALNDPDGWAQEYELKWLDEASAWLAYELLARCETDDLIEVETGWIRHGILDAQLTGAPQPPTGNCYLGWDIARRRDLSILWVLNEQGETIEIRRFRRASFEAQQAALRELMTTYNIRRGCLDQTGMGEVIVEQAQREFGEHRIEGVLFNNTVKQDLAVLLKQKYEDRRVTTPLHREVRDSLHAVKKLQTSAGNPRFDADRTEQGHADYFWAQALAVHAANNPVGPIEYQATGLPSPSLGAFDDGDPTAHGRSLVHRATHLETTKYGGYSL